MTPTQQLARDIFTRLHALRIDRHGTSFAEGGAAARDAKACLRGAKAFLGEVEIEKEIAGIKQEATFDKEQEAREELHRRALDDLLASPEEIPAKSR